MVNCVAADCATEGALELRVKDAAPSKQDKALN
jgi:hypothetical protein